MMTIIYFVLILGITVFIHELGHFLFAKKYGVYVYEFSLGMGPKLFKFNRKNDETNYCIRLFPIGGFVQMFGEESEEDKNIPKEKSLRSKNAFQRFMIMVAGVMMNFILAFVLLFFLGLFSKPSIDNVYVDGSSIKSLNDNDKIVSVDGKTVNNYDKLALELAIVKDKKFTMTVKDKNNKKKNIEINPTSIGKSNLLYEKEYGFSVVGTTVSESNNKQISKNDKIVFVNDVEVTSYVQMLNELKKYDKEVLLTFKDSKDNLKDVNIKILKNGKDELSGYSYGFYIQGEQVKGIFGALKYAIIKFFSTIEQMFFTVIYLITGRLSLNMLSGPVGIFNVVGQSAKAGFANIVSLLSLICINVGFINFLPLPAFDGGHILFIIIEKIKGSKVNPKVETTIHNIGFILLMILMVLITYNDILRIFKK